MIDALSTPLALGSVALTALSLAIHLAGEYRQTVSVQWIFKPLASTGFMVLAYGCGALDSTYGQTVFAALALSMVGDICLISKAQSAFLAGLVSFLLGHVAFAVSFVLLAPSWPVAAGAGVAVGTLGVFVFRWLRPGIPDPLRGPVIGYITVICAMVALAVGAYFTGTTWVVPVAATLFWLSDISVARARFTDAGFGNRLWGLPAYYLAQLLFALTVAADGLP